MDEYVIVDTVDAWQIDSGDWIAAGGKPVKIVNVIDDNPDVLTFEGVDENDEDVVVEFHPDTKVGIVGWM